MLGLIESDLGLLRSCDGNMDQYGCGLRPEKFRRSECSVSTQGAGGSFWNREVDEAGGEGDGSRT